MRSLLLVLTLLSSGCATFATAPPVGETETQTRLSANGRAAQTSGGRTQTIGLPLSRAGKIGLWAGVAVFLAYLMHSDGEDDDAEPVEP